MIDHTKIKYAMRDSLVVNEAIIIVSSTNKNHRSLKKVVTCFETIKIRT
ncbi:MAG: hypothetical protein ABR936_10495 [Bacteroidota bacterium]